MDPFADALDAIYAHSGVSATIRATNGPVVATTLYATLDPNNPPMGVELTEWRSGDDRAVFSFRRSEVVELPQGAIFEAPAPPDTTVRTWRVDSVARKDTMEISVVARQVRL